jgi:dTDP-L-rhamnose 4-epimerase
MMNKPLKIVITGGAGFIGSSLVRALLERSYEVTVLDNLSVQVHGVVPCLELDWLEHPCVRFVRGDLRDLASLRLALDGADTLIHLAAETGTGQSMYEIRHYYDVNVLATASLFEQIATRFRSIRKVILASSRSIYGEGAYRCGNQLVVPKARTKTQLLNGNWELAAMDGEKLELIATPETVSAHPASIYAATKLAIEQLGRVFAEAYAVPVVALRFQNVYGERQSLKNPYTGILSIFANRLKQGLPINVFEDGMESRDFVHVCDVVRSILAAVDVEVEGFNAINVGSGVATSVFEIAQSLKRLLASDSSINITGEFRVGDIRHCYADLRRAQEVLGFKPAVDIDTGLAAFCDWVRAQPVEIDRSGKALAELRKAGLS